MTNPTFALGGYKALRWVESDEPGEFRDANDYLQDHGHGCLSRTLGYYADSEGFTTIVPALYVLTAPCPDCISIEPSADNNFGRDCETCDGEAELYTYYSAYRDPHNDGCGVIDTTDGGPAADIAARLAHRLAEVCAECEREYQEKADAHLRATDTLPDALARHRAEHSYLIRALPHSGDDATGARIRERIRANAHDVVKAIRELRDQFDNFKGFEA